MVVDRIFFPLLDRPTNRPGKSCKCHQNSDICENGWTEIYVSNVGVAWWNPEILMAYPQSMALHPEFLILNGSFSILLLDPTSIFHLQLFFLHPHSKEWDIWLKYAAKRNRQHARIKWRLSSNERAHTKWGRTHNVTTWTDKQRGEEMQPQCNPINVHAIFCWQTKLTHKAIYWGSMLHNKYEVLLDA